jgi:F0F1-type ATP synthase membrane subunit b/b'
VLNDTSKAFHQECLSKLDACYAKELADTAEAFTKMSVPEVDEAKTGFKNIYDEAKEQSEKLLNAKLTEIEEGYQRYLSQQGESSQGDGNQDFSKSIHLGQYEE